MKELNMQEANSFEWITLQTLYKLSIKTQTSAIVLALITSYALYSQLHTPIYIWGILVILLALFRLYLSFLFDKYPKKFTYPQWYKLFTLFSILTSLSISSLGFWFIYQVNEFYQVIILAILIALSASAAVSLASDYKIAISYITIPIVPLTIAFTIQESTLGMTIPLLLVLFYISQISMIHKNYTQHRKVIELVQTNQNLLNENKMFIADMVHQIKTPLSTIMLNTSLMELKADNKTQPNIKQINSAINMLDNAYEDLAYIISNDTIEYAPKVLNISNFLHARIHFFNDIIQVNHKTIHTDITDGLSININDTELERLIDNNISNAIKHSHDNSKMTISLYQEASSIKLSFTSEGKHINEVSKIFEKNYTENNSAKRSLGLGLNMVKKICLKNNISFSAHSSNGINTFTYVFKV